MATLADSITTVSQEEVGLRTFCYFELGDKHAFRLGGEERLSSEEELDGVEQTPVTRR